MTWKWKFNDTLIHLPPLTPLISALLSRRPSYWPMQMDIVDIRLTFACVCTFLCFARFFTGEVDSNINHYPSPARFALVVNNGLVETNKGRSLSTHVFSPYLLFLNDCSPFCISFEPGLAQSCVSFFLPSCRVFQHDETRLNSTNIDSGIFSRIFRWQETA